MQGSPQMWIPPMGLFLIVKIKKKTPPPRPYTETLNIVFQMFPSKLTK